MDQCASLDRRLGNKHVAAVVRDEESEPFAALNH
jgi:hypothetical protein